MDDQVFSETVRAELTQAEQALMQFEEQAGSVLRNAIPKFAKAGFGTLTQELNSSLARSNRSLSSFGDQVKQIFNSSLSKVSSQVLNQAIFQPLTGALTGAFGGARMNGGPVQPNQAFLVGEKGPELFVPPSQGTVVPHKGNAQNITVNIQTQDAQSFVQSRAQVQASIANAVRQGSKRL